MHDGISSVNQLHQDIGEPELGVDAQGEVER
jgi:hypothetical protein